MEKWTAVEIMNPRVPAIEMDFSGQKREVENSLRLDSKLQKFWFKIVCECVCVYVKSTILLGVPQAIV